MAKQAIDPRDKQVGIGQRTEQYPVVAPATLLPVLKPHRAVFAAPEELQEFSLKQHLAILTGDVSHGLDAKVFLAEIDDELYRAVGCRTEKSVESGRPQVVGGKASLRYQAVLASGVDVQSSRGEEQDAKRSGVS